MNLSEPFIRRPIMTSLVMFGVFAFGIIAFQSLAVSDLPDIPSPTITVYALNPGSDAQTMANNVATPLELQMMAIPGVQSILSNSSEGSTNIVINFDLDRNIDGAATDVTAAINQASGNLPPEMPTLPTYQKTNPADTPIIYIAVSSESMTQSELYDFATKAVSQRISILDGVSKVNVYGSMKSVRVKLNPDTMAGMNIGIDQVTKAIQDANQSLPAGNLYDKYVSYTLIPEGQLETGESYNKIIVAQRDNQPIYMSDLGHGVDSLDMEHVYLRYWSQEKGYKPSVVVAVTKQSGSNTVALCDTIVNMLPFLRSQLPPSIDLEVIHNGADPIEASISDVEFTLVLAFILVVMVIFLFLGNMSTTIIPSISLPLSILGTFVIMFINGYSIDILSMLGLTLVVGFLVDDAIVVLENIVRHMEEGKPPFEAALDGSKQISTTVLSMTLALSTVFVPMIFMPGKIGRMFHEFAMVVVCAVLFSGAISLILTPMLCSLFLRPSKQSRLEKFSHQIVDYLLSFYRPMLKWVLDKPFVPVLLTSAGFVAALFLFQTIPQDFLPAGDTGVIEGLTIADQSVSYDQMAELQDSVNEVIKDNPSVSNLISVANVSGVSLPNQGLLFVILKDVTKRPPIADVTQQLNRALAPLIGVETFLHPIPQINLSVGTGTQRADYTYYLSTLEEPEKLYAYAKKLTKELKTLPELADVSLDVEDNNPQLTINILRDQASMFGITTKAIEQAFQFGYGGGRISTFKTPLNVYNVVVQMEDEYRLNPDALNKIRLASTNKDAKELVPLRSVAEWKETTGPMEVNHIDQFTSATIYFNVAPGQALSTALKKVEQAADELLPQTIIRQFQGEAAVFQETIKSMAGLLIMGVLVIYLLLGSLYESYIHPITILSTLPGALFGGLITLFIFNATLSIYAYVGMIVLIGIVLKNGIMLVEFANELVEEGKSAYDAISEASTVRFRPILMTTIAAAMGAVPIALGMGADAASRRPLGLVILGGLFFAQLITYFFTPVVYLFTQRLQQRFFKK